MKVKKEEDDDGEEKSRGEETRKVYGVKCQSASPSKHNYDRREEEEGRLWAKNEEREPEEGGGDLGYTLEKTEFESGNDSTHTRSLSKEDSE